MAMFLNNKKQGWYLTFFYILFALSAFVLAIEDFLFFRISNLIIALQLALFVAMVLIFKEPIDFLFPGIAFIVVMGVGFILFNYQMIGAGDVKFIATASAWFMLLGDIAGFLLLTSLVGGLLALFYLFLGTHIEILRLALANRVVKIMPWAHLEAWVNYEPEIATLKKHKKIVPYGTAVGMACIVMVIIRMMANSL